MRGEDEYGTDLHSSGQLHDSRPGTAEGSNAHRQIWMLRKTFLKNHRKGMYARLILSGKLNSHLSEIDLTARECIERITTKLLENSPAPDKASSQMAWVGHMNNLRYQAEETVLAELIYS